jgi:hypothetical protein
MKPRRTSKARRKNRPDVRSTQRPVDERMLTAFPGLKPEFDGSKIIHLAYFFKNIE